MDVKSLFATQRYAASKPAVDPGQTAQHSATERFTDTFKDFSATLAQSENIAKAAMTGGADPHALVQALAQTELAVEAAVTVRNKVVEAYQEILRMPV
ncbi:flagellar hook-basal body complex protein FliE [Planktotalea arctica]|uniref:flagellar hook-basal body complex protein FliE n=1 Tax=Planktotalea arctica TaxID=1481893 RepID=UPI000A16FB7A|nr:flagellar hook-basal body complex protein FliE [Planktotalea arctica]